MIHEITGPLIPEVLPGVRGVHAVDAAGVHPLLLAIGSERYMPFLNVGAAARIAHASVCHLGQGPVVLGQVSC